MNAMRQRESMSKIFITHVTTRSLCNNDKHELI